MRGPHGHPVEPPEQLSALGLLRLPGERLSEVHRDVGGVRWDEGSNLETRLSEDI